MRGQKYSSMPSNMGRRGRLIAISVIDQRLGHVENCYWLQKRIYKSRLLSIDPRHNVLKKNIIQCGSHLYWHQSIDYRNITVQISGSPQRLATGGKQ